MIALFGKQGRDVPQREWSNAIRFEVANLRRDRSVSGPIRVRALSGRTIAILFPVETDRVADPEFKEIIAVEPIALVYNDGAVGVGAPAVFSDRADFPRELPHLNTVADDSPVSICLAREGLQPLYEREGVAGVLTRLRTWLCDAKTGSLSYDGWEPVPASTGAGTGILDGARFQEFATSAGDNPGRAWAVAFLTPEGNFALFLHQILVVADGGFDRACDEMKQRGLTIGEDDGPIPVPVVFLWQPTSAAVGEAVFRGYRNGGEFQQDLRRLGLGQRFDLALGEFLTSRWKSAANAPCGVVVLVGVRRPKAIIRDRVGLSADPESRRLEIKAFLLQAEKRDGLLSEAASVREISLMPASNREILTSVSGVRPTCSPCLIGCGALGGEIGEFLTRMGVAKITFVDGDHLLAHNLARHVGVIGDLLTPKAAVLARGDARVVRAGEQSNTYIVKEIAALDASEEAQITQASNFLIDATASDRVRRSLPALARRIGKRIARVEIFDGGLLGVQSIEGGEGNPDLLDLYYALCRRALDDEAVGAWLQREQAGIAALDTIAAGFSCSSPSFRIPKWRVSGHAAAFMPAITALVEGECVAPGLGLNVVSEKGSPLGFRWLNVLPFDVQQANGWEVRVDRAVDDELQRFSRERAPNETGGYLYGGLDLDLRRITVVVASSQPANSVGSPMALRLGKAGTTPEEAMLRRRCGTRIVVVGTWHSHPGGSAELSDKDVRTATAFRRENRSRGLPTLLMVCGARSVGRHVLE